eukprot:m51a1_g3849 hypothetical protein (340) ;mRNA; f:380688-382534
MSKYAAALSELFSSWFFGSKKREHRPIKAVIVHSHSGGKRVWDYLGRHWNEFGAARLLIAHQREFTLESLIKAAPDVIVCSDPAGAPYQYTAQEISDIQSYLTMGVCRHLIGTYATFYHQEGSPSMPHMMLASLFGLDPSVPYTTKKLSGQPKYDIAPECKDSVLWKDVGTSYCTWGYSSTQIPVSSGGLWVRPGESQPVPLLPGADVRVLAKTPDNLCIVLNHVAECYSSLYISHMPEYESLRKTKADVQFLYNSFVFLANQGNSLSLLSRCIDVASRSLSSRTLSERVPLCSLPTELQERLLAAARLSGRYDERRLRELFGSCSCNVDASFSRMVEE